MLARRRDDEALWGGETALVAAIDGYSFDVDGPTYKVNKFFN